MELTESEAEDKACVHPVLIHAGEFDRINCLGSKCMAWEWVAKETVEFIHIGCVPIRKDLERSDWIGRCSLCST